MELDLIGFGPYSAPRVQIKVRPISNARYPCLRIQGLDPDPSLSPRPVSEIGSEFKFGSFKLKVQITQVGLGSTPLPQRHPKLFGGKLEHNLARNDLNIPSLSLKYPTFPGHPRVWGQFALKNLKGQKLKKIYFSLDINLMKTGYPIWRSVSQIGFLQPSFSWDPRGLP